MAIRLAFIGAGNMAEAIARAAIEQNILKPSEMIACDRATERQAVFAKLGIAIADTIAQAIDQAEHVMLAVKPQAMPDIANELTDLREQQILISIMAGMTTAKLQNMIAGSGGKQLRIVRVMPNTPMLVGLGMAGIALGEHAKAGDETLTMQLFQAGNSQAVQVEESQLDAVTAVSGSGPAYLFYLAQAMTDAAQTLGVAEHAALLVNQTLLGAATLLAQSEDDAATLRAKVTSPGGTTQAATEYMDAKQMQQIIRDALAKAAERSVELGQ